jgi:multiple sugar transport system ATP-binding protein
MDSGHIVQLGTPGEIYDRPNSLFVAKFVGSPAMNFLPGALVEDDHGLVLDIGRPGSRPDCSVALGRIGRRELSGRQVVVGVRPEAIYLAADETREGECVLRRPVDVIEPTGADTLAIFNVAGSEVTARLGPGLNLAVGDARNFVLEPTSFHIFDQQTQLRLDIGREPVDRKANSPSLRAVN